MYNNKESRINYKDEYFKDIDEEPVSTTKRYYSYNYLKKMVKENIYDFFSLMNKWILYLILCNLHNRVKNMDFQIYMIPNQMEIFIQEY